jgi:hypothetical protein
MDRHYYVEKEHETSETSDRQEAARIAAEWARRGYKVETVVVDATDESVQLADSTEVIQPKVRVEAGIRASA